jgi:hypothetical protein
LQIDAKLKKFDEFEDFGVLEILREFGKFQI